MNFGFGSSCEGWDESKKGQLFVRLRKELKLDELHDSNGSSPYLEVDGLYRGVRIRRITHLSEADQERLVLKAERIYAEVMGVDLHPELLKAMEAIGV